MAPKSIITWCSSPEKFINNALPFFFFLRIRGRDINQEKKMIDLFKIAFVTMALYGLFYSTTSTTTSTTIRNNTETVLTCSGSIPAGQPGSAYSPPCSQ
jgi:hypothetical protein